MFLGIDEKNSAQLAVIGEDGSKLTYGDLVQYSIQFGNHLADRSLVFVLCRNTIGALLGYVGCLVSSHVPLLLSADLDESLLHDLTKVYMPNYLWIPLDKLERIRVILSDISGEESPEPVMEQAGYVLLKLTDQKIEMYSELALLLTTSGSTGSPKLVRQSYKNICSNASSIAEYLELDTTERPITTLPMNYTYGLSVINSHLLIGATILMTEQTYAQRGFWELFKREQATSIAGVPYTYVILKKLRFFQMDLPSLRYMTQAGGKLMPELHKEYAEYAMEHGKRFYVMYGQTEATARMGYLPYDQSLDKYGSMGIAIPGGTFTLIDGDGEEIIEPGCVGELVYQGPNVTLGYAQCQEDLNKGDEWKGVLVTGDMAQRDADGFYYIVGRKKRFLKLFGNRVNLDEVERLLKTEIPELNCACAGVDDKLMVYVVRDLNNNIDEQRMIHILTEKTKLHPSAFAVKWIDSIPLNEAGKVIYAELENC